MSTLAPHIIEKKIFIRLAELANWHTRTVIGGMVKWQDKTQDFIDSIMDTAPSGSGIDCGTELRIDDCTPTKLVFGLSFHHMNEHGCYDGWSDHEVIIKPTFGGFSMRITGRDRNGIKEYLADVYDCWLNELTTH
jgi:hypothetical protein